MSTTTKAATSGHKMPCPHCETQCLTVKTKPVTRTYREITYACPECGHVFVASLSPLRTLVPSERPHKDVRIPA